MSVRHRPDRKKQIKLDWTGQEKKNWSGERLLETDESGRHTSVRHRWVIGTNSHKLMSQKLKDRQ